MFIQGRVALLACLSCVVQSRRVSSLTEANQNLEKAEVDSSNALGALLLACSHHHAFHSRGTRRPSQSHSALWDRRQPPRMIAETLVVDPNYNLAAGAAVLATILGGLEDLRSSDGNKLPTAKLFGGGALLGLLFAGFIAFQTGSNRFTFDDSSFALVKSSDGTAGENVVVGGENRWKYNTFVNYDFLPSEDFPILVYFKETQTPVANREEVPIKVDDADGQVHFFPAISNTQQLKTQFVQRGIPKL